jgi:hypothetical protein
MSSGVNGLLAGNVDLKPKDNIMKADIWRCPYERNFIE